MNAALLQIPVSKGILSRNQANSLGAASGAARTQQLLLLLKQKGLLSDSDMAALQAGLPERPRDHMLADISTPTTSLRHRSVKPLDRQSRRDLRLLRR